MSLEFGSTLCGSATVAVLLIGLAACSTTPPTSPELLARCNTEYSLWVRYNQNYPSPTGQKLRADLALYRCQTGQYHPALEELEDILRRTKVPIPD